MSQYSPTPPPNQPFHHQGAFPQYQQPPGQLPANLPANPYQPAPRPAYGGTPGPGPVGPPGQPQDTTTLLLLTVVTGGIWGLIWHYRTGEDLKRFTGTGIGGGGHLLLSLFLGIVDSFVLPNEIEQAYHRVGRPSPVSAMTGLWVLLGFLVIPLFIYLYTVNGALNDLWRSQQPQMYQQQTYR